MPEASGEAELMSLTLLSHSIHNDLAFPAPGLLEASGWKESERTFRRWHHDNRSDGWQADTGDGDETQRHSRSYILDSPRIDEPCLVKKHSNFSRAFLIKAKKMVI